MTVKDRRYWDSCSFLAWFNQEEDKVEECESVLHSAEAEKIEIVTSAVTLTEVIRIKGKPKLAKDKAETIKRFFDQDYILVVDLDRFVAEKARQYIWEFESLKPKDALHLATAVNVGCPHLDTFDDDLLKLDGQLQGVDIKIARPSLPRQLEIDDDEEG